MHSTSASTLYSYTCRPGTIVVHPQVTKRKVSVSISAVCTVYLYHFNALFSSFSPILFVVHVDEVEIDFQGDVAHCARPACTVTANKCVTLMYKATTATYVF